jgi:hypothetical protein
MFVQLDVTMMWLDAIKCDNDVIKCDYDVIRCDIIILGFFPNLIMPRLT